MEYEIESTSTLFDPDVAVGAVLGSAIGDATGAGYEFRTPVDDEYVGMIGGGPFKWAPGQWTDDTEVSVALLLGAVDAQRDFNVSDTPFRYPFDSALAVQYAARRFCNWYVSGPKDVGTTTYAAFSHAQVRGEGEPELMAQYLREGSMLHYHANSKRFQEIVDRDFYDLAPIIATQGCGGIMRLAPSLAISTSFDDALAFGTAQSSLTHHEPVAMDCARVLTSLIWHLGVGSSPTTENRVHAMMLATQASALWPNRWAELLTAYERAAKANSEPRQLHDAIPVNSSAAGALACALWVTMRAFHETTVPTEMFSFAIEQAVRLGGDTDSVAAITGALIGVLVGGDWLMTVDGYRLNLHGNAECWDDSPILDWNDLRRLANQAGGYADPF